MVEWMGGEPGRSRKVQGIRIDLKSDEIREVLSWLGSFDRKRLGIEKPAVNATARMVKRRAAARLAAILNLDRKRVEDAFTIYPYKTGRPWARIVGLGKDRPTLFEYDPEPAQPTHRGEQVSVLVRKDQGRQNVYGFITKPLAGKRQGRLNIYRREGDERYPLFLLYGPRPMQVLRDEPGLLDEITRYGSNVLAAELSRQFDKKLENAK